MEEVEEEREEEEILSACSQLTRAEKFNPQLVFIIDCISAHYTRLDLERPARGHGQDHDQGQDQRQGQGCHGRHSFVRRASGVVV